MIEQRVKEFDTIQPELRDEPAAHKRACFRAGYLAALEDVSQLTAQGVGEIADAQRQAFAAGQDVEGYQLHRAHTALLEIDSHHRNLNDNWTYVADAAARFVEDKR